MANLSSTKRTTDTTPLLPVSCRSLSPPANQDTATIYHESDRSKKITLDEKASAPQSRSKYHETPLNDTGFQADSRKNIVSYCIGNIDTDSTKRDIYYHMRYSRVTPTLINVYYGEIWGGCKSQHPHDQCVLHNNGVMFVMQISKLVLRGSWLVAARHYAIIPRRCP